MNVAGVTSRESVITRPYECQCLKFGYVEQLGMGQSIINHTFPDKIFLRNLETEKMIKITLSVLKSALYDTYILVYDSGCYLHQKYFCFGVLLN